MPANSQLGLKNIFNIFPFFSLNVFYITKYYNIISYYIVATSYKYSLIPNTAFGSPPLPASSVMVMHLYLNNLHYENYEIFWLM